MTDDDTPLLQNWRMVAGTKLVGEVTGHPWIEDGWMLTSRLVSASDPIARTAQCESRVYRLGEPWPVDEPMPRAAREIVIRGILVNLRPFAVEDLAKAHHAAKTLAEAAFRPCTDGAWSGFIQPDQVDAEVRQ